MADCKKKLRFKFYDVAGNYITTINGSDFKNYPEFTLDINGGLSELRMTLAYGFNDWWYSTAGIMSYPWGMEYTEGRSMTTPKGKERLYAGLSLGYIVKVFVDDKEGETQIYSGIYVGFELNFAEGGEKETIHNFIPNIAVLQAKILKDISNNTTVDYNSIDPSDIFRNIIDVADSEITYDENSVKDTGVSRTYSFVSHNCLDALRQSIKLTPNHWIWYIGGDDLLHLFNTEIHATKHYIGINQVISVKINKNISYIRNSVLFLGGGSPALFKKYDSSGSQNMFGVWEEKIVDESVEDESTADIIASRYLEDNKAGINYFTLEIADSNFSKNGYDIESINPGDKIILNTQRLDFAYNLWGTFNWGYAFWLYDIYAITGIPMIVKKITYKYTSIVVECAYTIDNQEQRIEDIKRDLTKYRFKDAPTIPTT